MQKLQDVVIIRIDWTGLSLSVAAGVLWCVKTFLSARFQSGGSSFSGDHVMWRGGGESTTSFIQADLENTIDTLKWPSNKGSSGGTAQQMTCFDRVGVGVRGSGGGGGGVQGRRSLIVGATLLSSCTLCAHE